MEREKLTLFVFVLSVILAWIFSTSFLMFSALFFLVSVILTLYLSHKYIEGVDYKLILKEIKEEYKNNILRFFSFERISKLINSIFSKQETQKENKRGKN